MSNRVVFFVVADAKYHIGIDDSVEISVLGIALD